MKISYDPEIDALYIRFVEGKRQCRTVRLNQHGSMLPDSAFSKKSGAFTSSVQRKYLG